MSRQISVRASAALLGLLLYGGLAPGKAHAQELPAKDAKEAPLGTMKARKILFLGNSITLHGPAPNIGWSGNWGMAASAQEKDFAHLVIARLAEATGNKPEAMIDNVADFERRYDTFDVSTVLKKQLDFKADIVVVAIGENVPAFPSEDSKAKFRAAVAGLLAALKKSGSPAIVVRSCFWPDKTKDGILRETCTEAGGAFVDISSLSQDESHFARSERKYEHAGVAAHPGDKGMQAIADAVWKAIAAPGPGALRAQIGAYYFDGWAGKHKLAEKAEWAKNAPTHLTARMLKEFPDREPAWGWRDDSLEIMERQIDAAADHGLAFFAFDWYFHQTEKEVKGDPLHTGLELFLKARNNGRMKFCLLAANHAPFDIRGEEGWKKAAAYWMPLFTHKQHLTAGGKPLVFVFSSGGGDKAGFARLQEAARQAGLPGVAIAGCGAASREIGYTHASHYNIVAGWEKGLQEHKYQELVQDHERAWKGSREQPYIPCLIAGWDRRPWEEAGGKCCWYYPDRTPEAFGAHAKAAVDWMDKHPEQITAERLAVICAWNEFGEGSYIAPTKGDEGKYLKALRAAVKP